MNEHLNGLNAQQRKAVEYGIGPGKTNDVGPLLVIAGAGSGKTATLASCGFPLVSRLSPEASEPDCRTVIELCHELGRCSNSSGKVTRISEVIISKGAAR
jgi:DNA helicase-2/ATP-dependent DNA helicase PcrA